MIANLMLIVSQSEAQQARQSTPLVVVRGNLDLHDDMFSKLPPHQPYTKEQSMIQQPSLHRLNQRDLITGHLNVYSPQALYL